MAITLVGTQAGNRAGSTSTSNVNFALTGGSDTVPRGGDLVFIQVVVGSQARNPACAVSGYTALGLLNASAQTQDTSMDVSYKFMGGTPDTAFTLPSTGNNADGQSYTVRVYRGVDRTTPLDVTTTSATGTGTSRANPPSITPSTAGAWPVCFGGGGAAATTALAFGDLTAVVGDVASDTNDSAAYSGHKTNWSSGAFDCSASTTGSNNAVDSWCAYSIVLRPAANISTFTEDFQATLDAGKWTKSETNGTVTFTGGSGDLAVNSGGAGNTARIDSVNTKFNLIGSEVYVRLDRAIRVSGDVSGAECGFGVHADNSNDELRFVVTTDSTLIVTKIDDAVTTQLATITSAYYANEATYRWLKISESGGTITFSTAADTASNPPSGGDWTSRHTVALNTVGNGYGNCGVVIYAYEGVSRTITQDLKVDGLNCAGSSTTINATFAATETTTDTFAAVGDTAIDATFAAVESGAADTFAATADTAIDATLAATEGTADTFAATGQTVLYAALAATDAYTDVFASTATVVITGSLAATDAYTDVLAATAAVYVAATLAATETTTDTFAATAAVYVAAALAATDAYTDTLAATAAVVVTGVLAATDAYTDVLAATGTVEVTATVAATETDVDVFAATGTVLVSAVMAATDALDTFAATSTVLVSAALAAVETTTDVFAASATGDAAQVTFAVVESTVDTWAATATLTIAAALTAVETDVDTFNGTVLNVIAAALAVTDAYADTFASSATLEVLATFAAVEDGAADTLAGTATVTVTAVLAAIESGAADSFAASAALKIAAVFAAVEDTADVFYGVLGTPEITATIAAVETSADALSATVSNVVAATLAAVESAVADTFASTAQIIVTATCGLTEQVNDLFAATGSLPLAAVFAAIESSVDVFEASSYGVPPKQYPLAGILQGYPGVAQTYPLAGINQDYPL